MEGGTWVSACGLGTALASIATEMKDLCTEMTG